MATTRKVVRATPGGVGSGEDAIDGAAPGGDDKGIVAATRVVALCTVASKVTGLVREVLLTSLFGIGPVMDAFAYACVVPAYFQMVAGGFNGPFHTAVLVAARRRRKVSVEEAPTLKTLVSTKHLVESLSSWAVLPASLIACALFFFPGPVLGLFAPGLASPGPDGLLELSIATQQLRIMAPCVLTGVLTGIAFGGLNAAGHFLSPSISQALANAMMVCGIIAMRGLSGGLSALSSGRQLATAFLMGSVVQLLLQSIVMQKKGVGALFRPRLRLSDLGVVAHAARILLPAILSSTMLQLSTYTDLWFASSWQGSAAVMACAAMITTAPIGLLGSAIIVPRMPRLAQQAADSDWQGFRMACDSMLRTSISVGLPLTISFCFFAKQIVSSVYERSAFTSDSTAQVVPVVVVYALGIAWFICRDVVVRAFYALDRGKIPVITSVAALVLNAVLDAYLSRTMASPAVGLVFSTVLVSCLSTVALYWALHKILRDKVGPAGSALGGLKWRKFLLNTLCASGITMCHSKWLLHKFPTLQSLLKSSFHFSSAWRLETLGLSVGWLLDASLVGASLVSAWAVYYLCLAACDKMGSGTPKDLPSH
ncbi:putative murein biosynthesis integral membrane protein MurJ [Chloropicon primus]|uniref:Putative murein biosynthesis integral membrane protein MurJ n=1 Tax=Chloropicon primus TaxID=1764295 RepID=A0A5B8MUQ1_9CHLO|nr:putative murein biosynthesis integral membrane protein MurJ [Chloropicon primus]UPR03736.1 putative murein biosynthesis integral membrane protein MurJ [Chloropicon primus]|eukprot:QDZ24528.1 putative murein biosynthesis integral membrane protein MurJ [Chloropicon primus]